MSSAAAEAPISSERVARYEIIRRIAEGGMAEIFLARTTGIEGFEKVVVLKRILRKLALDRQCVRMFLQEAKLAAGLHHANIVQVYDVGQADGSYFFTMEYVHGVDVHALLPKPSLAIGRMPLEHAIWIVRESLAGLHHAHELRGASGEPLGLVHRDVSPSNVLVGFDGSVKLTDFGIAKATQRSDTRSGTLRGKLAYMSPEQCASELLDRRSDLFSFGAMLYQLTTGVLPFQAPGDYLLLRQIVEESPPSPREIMADYPVALERIVMRALAKSRSDRYQTARDMQEELEAFAHEHRMLQSPRALASYVERIAGERALAWQRAQAAGVSLVEHVTETLTGEDLDLPATISIRPMIVVDNHLDRETLARTDLPTLQPRRRWWIPTSALALAAMGGILYIALATTPPASAPTTDPVPVPANAAPTPTPLPEPTPIPPPAPTPAQPTPTVPSTELRESPVVRVPKRVTTRRHREPTPAPTKPRLETRPIELGGHVDPFTTSASPSSTRR